MWKGQLAEWTSLEMGLKNDFLVHTFDCVDSLGPALPSVFFISTALQCHSLANLV